MPYRASETARQQRGQLRDLAAVFQPARLRSGWANWFRGYSEEYISRMVEVFREVRRVLKPEGSLWVNIGDSYAGSMKGAANYPENAMNYKQGTNRGTLGVATIVKKYSGYKRKDLIGIPWMLGLCLTCGWLVSPAGHYLA